MSAAVSFASLTDGQIEKRFTRLIDFLDDWGELTALDAGGALDRRLLEFSLEAPGDGWPAQVKVLYREHYRRSGKTWDIAKYTYEYFDVARLQRLAYHMHDIRPRVLVAHAHCGGARGVDEAETSDHLRATEMDLREAHHEFMSLWAAESAPDCGAFRPLEVDREA